VQTEQSVSFRQAERKGIPAEQAPAYVKRRLAEMEAPEQGPVDLDEHIAHAQRMKQERPTNQQLLEGGAPAPGASTGIPGAQVVEVPAKNPADFAPRSPGSEIPMGEVEATGRDGRPEAPTVAPEPSKSPLIAWAEKLEREAHQEAANLGNKLFSTPFNPSDYLPLVKIVAAKVARGLNAGANRAYKFADWSAEAVEKFGDAIRPYIDKIWEESQRLVKPETLNLTDREWRVFSELAEGRTRRQIAESEGISTHTVKRLASSVRKKLGFYEPDITPALQEIADRVHAGEEVPIAEIAKAGGWTRRQEEIMRLLGEDGLSQEQAGLQIDISRRSVQVAREAALQTIGADLGAVIRERTQNTTEPAPGSRRHRAKSREMEAIPEPTPQPATSELPILPNAQNARSDDRPITSGQTLSEMPQNAVALPKSGVPGPFEQKPLFAEESEGPKIPNLIADTPARVREAWAKVNDPASEWNPKEPLKEVFDAANLTKQARGVISDYLRGMTYEEVGAKNGLSRQRIGQVMAGQPSKGHKGALEKLGLTMEVFERMHEEAARSRMIDDIAEGRSNVLPTELHVDPKEVGPVVLTVADAKELAYDYFRELSDRMEKEIDSGKFTDKRAEWYAKEIERVNAGGAPPRKAQEGNDRGKKRGAEPASVSQASLPEHQRQATGAAESLTPDQGQDRGASTPGANQSESTSGTRLKPESLREQAERWTNEGAAEIKAKTGRLFQGFDPTLIPPLVKYLAGKIITTGFKFADWAAAAKSRFGDGIEPHLRDIYDQAEKLSKEAVNFFGNEGPTGPRNAVVDRERLDRGKEPIVKKLRDSWGSIQDQAEQAHESNPDIGQQKVNDYLAKPRAFEGELDQAIVMNHRVRMRNEYDNAVQEVNKHIEGGAAKSLMGSDAELAAARIREATVEAKLDAADAVLKNGGSALGGALNARKMMVAEDFSLAHMTQQRQAKAGRKLTDGERLEVQKLHDKIKGLQDRVDAADEKQTAPAKNRETGNLAQRLARQFVEGGMHDREQVIDAVHAELNKRGYEMERRETMDAISGYGKYSLLSKEEAAVKLRDLKGQMQQLAKLEDMQAGQAPLKTGIERREPSAEERQLIKEVNEAKKKGGYDVVDPDKQLKTALDAVKTRLRNQIEDITRSIDAKTPIVKEKIGLKYDAEADTLRTQRDTLKEQYDSIFGKKEMTDEQRIRLATSAVEKSIAEYERKIKEKDIAPLGRVSKTPNTPELEALRARRDAMREELQSLRDIAKPPKTPEEIRNQIFKTATTKKIADLQERIARGDFEKPAKREPRALNAENTKLKAELEQARDEWREGNLKLEAEKRPIWQKVLGVASKWRRGFILSSPVTLAKLSAAAAWRMVTSPMEQGTAHLIGAVFPKLAEKAVYEGPTSVAIEARAFTEGFTRLVDDFKSVMKTGEMDIGHLYGDKHFEVDPSIMDYIGRVHGALKTVPKRAAFTRALMLGTEAAMKQGLDVTDPAIQMRLGVEAYKQAERAIFQQDNWITDRWKRAMTPIVDPATGKETTGSAVTRFIGQNVLPIVKVPTNIAIETFQHALGSVTGSVQLAHAYAKGIESLPQAQADSIVRQLKKGSVGLAAMALGYYLRNDIGGLYQHGEHRRPDEPDFGEVRIGGWKIPAYLLHNPLVATLQIGATVGRLADKRGRHGEETGMPAAMGLAMLGLADEIPFVREMSHVGDLVHGHPGSFIGQEVKGLVVPQAVDWTARQLDRDAMGTPIRRRPTGVWEYVQSGLPVLRERLPVRLR
jgi:DNA-binding NarL/FixJ family response regulator